ncbi:MAG: XkdX family protein [Clostridium sp.]|nr:XkdX family protein [Clostridium sp.]MDU7339216.1 XkdX family protein [Clostridium sp.]
MFETLKRLYDSDKLNKAMLSRAIGKGWITAQQYKEITMEDYHA